MELNLLFYCEWNYQKRSYMERPRTYPLYVLREEEIYWEELNFVQKEEQY